jgi:acetate kinase
MTTILTVNSGSTSVKLAAFRHAQPQGTLLRVEREHLSGAAGDPAEILRAFAAKTGRDGITAVAHRVVHGGSYFSQPVQIDDEVESRIESLCELAPLHNPPALRWIRAARGLWSSQVRHTAVFDTAFYAQLPRVAAEYALPRSAGLDQSIRRYGFHGIAHEAMWRRWCELRPDLPRGGRLITLQLGGGCSITATLEGRAIYTSMGFSPLEGMMMATR